MGPFRPRRHSRMDSCRFFTALPADWLKDNTCQPWSTLRLHPERGLRVLVPAECFPAGLWVIEGIPSEWGCAYAGHCRDRITTLVGVDLG